jgi:hypothetical protein
VTSPNESEFQSIKGSKKKSVIFSQISKEFFGMKKSINVTQKGKDGSFLEERKEGKQ